MFLIQNPDFTALQNFFSLLSHGCKQFVSHLPRKHIDDLHKCLGAALLNSDTGVLLAALACIARLAPDESGVKSYSTDLLSGPKCLKVLRLTGDMVAAACSLSPDSTLTVHEHDDLVQHNATIVLMAIDISKAVDRDSLRSWISSKLGIQLRNKVVEKYKSRYINPAITNATMQYIAFLHSVDPEVSELQLLLDSHLSPGPDHNGDVQRYVALGDLWRYLKSCKVVPEGYMRYLKSAYQFITTAPALDSLTCAKLLALDGLISTTLDMVAPSSTLKSPYNDSLAEYFNTFEFASFIARLKAESTIDSSQHFSSILPSRMQRLKCKLLMIPLNVASSTSLEAGTMHHLNGKLLAMICHQDCKFTQVPPGDSYSIPVLQLIEHPATQAPRQLSHSVDWRAKLFSDLEQDTFRHHESMVTFFTRLCRDLESRCNTAELPVQGLEVKIGQLEDENYKLTTEMHDTMNTIKSYEREAEELRSLVSGITGDLHHSNDRCQQLASENIQLRDEISRITTAAQMTVDREKQAFDKKIEDDQHDHFSRVSVLQERIEGLEKLVDNLKKTRDDLQVQNHKLDNDKAHLTDHIIELETERRELEVTASERNVRVNGLLQTVSTMENFNTQLQDKSTREVEQLQIINKDITRRLEHETAKSRELTSSVDSLRLELTNAVMRLEKEARQMERQHSERMQQVSNQSIHTVDGLQAQLSEATRRAKVSADTARQAIDAYRTKLKSTQQKSLALVNELQARVAWMAENEQSLKAELDRVKKFSKKLMSLMELNMENELLEPARHMQSSTNFQHTLDDTNISLDSNIQDDLLLHTPGSQLSQESAASVKTKNDALTLETGCREQGLTEIADKFLNQPQKLSPQRPIRTPHEAPTSSPAGKSGADKEN
ncbi:uncharacterized protein V1518DRAFT_406555 [Limtongia smithiae]|uniref:uncharacterized protein n=1 Tax=Limtongia smithiae TaxID=1125753 RepID=UPI0034CF546D